MIEKNSINSFCRDCNKIPENADLPCQNCKSRRIIAHKELFSLNIAHLDCDSFFAAIEKRDDPSLEHKPVIVGGGRRGVVSTCCYIARTYGVHSAMPMFKALKVCPQAVVIAPNFQKYSEAGNIIREMMKGVTPLVEPLSIDEAFMDLSGTERVHGAAPAITMAKLARQIHLEVGVTVSIGLSHNKFLAKIASDMDKPSGFFVIGKEETKSFLAKHDIRLIWGIGKKTADRLAGDGLKTIAQMQKMDPKILMERYGETGLRLSRLAQGLDYRPVRPNSETKSISAETTFNEDIDTYERLEDILWDLCEKISLRMKSKQFFGRVITLKLKTNQFKTISRRITLELPGNMARTAFDEGRKMLEREMDGRKFRLIGIGYSDLTPADKLVPQEDFFGGDRKRLIAREEAVDSIRTRFGDHSIGAGRSLKKK